MYMETACPKWKARAHSFLLNKEKGIHRMEIPSGSNLRFKKTKTKNHKHTYDPTYDYNGVTVSTKLHIAARGAQDGMTA